MDVRLILLLLFLPAKAGATACVRLETGQSAVIDLTNEQSRTTVGAHYKLTRKARNHYLVELNLKFRLAPDNDDKTPDQMIDKIYRKRTITCLRESPVIMKDQEKTLEIRLSSAPDIPQQTIRVRKAGHRATSDEFNDLMGCTTYIHEIMHMLGLVDEYPETSNGYRIENDHYVFTNDSAPYPYDCRAKVPPDSVMHTTDHAVLEKYSVEECVCPEGVDCELLAARSNGRECPEGSKLGTSEQYLMPASEVNAIVTPRSFTLTKGKVERLNREITTYLYPAHYRAITEPGCMDVNRCYFACSKNAYRFMGLLPRDPTIAPHSSCGCVHIPKDCTDSEWGCLK